MRISKTASNRKRHIYYTFCGLISASFSSIVCFSDYVEELGHPYMWVQNLGGLQFPLGASEVGVYPCCHPIGAQILTLAAIMLSTLVLSQSVCSGSSLSASQMENTMKLLKRRLQSRLALHRQFASLGMFLVHQQIK